MFSDFKYIMQTIQPQEVFIYALVLFKSLNVKTVGYTFAFKLFKYRRQVVSAFTRYRARKNKLNT